MGEEAFDQVVLAGRVGNGKTRLLYVRGGYSRDEVWVGIGEVGGTDPDVMIEVDGKDLKRALRSIVIGEQRRRKQRT